MLILTHNNGTVVAVNKNFKDIKPAAGVDKQRAINNYIENIREHKIELDKLVLKCKDLLDK